MMTQPRGCRTSRSKRALTRVRVVIAVIVMIAAPSQARRVQSAADTTPPSVSITSPAAGQQLSRNATISASASDAVGVTSVTFKVDGAVIGTDSKAPYSARWNTRGAADGLHTLQAEARDAAGNTATSAPVVVRIGSPADTIAPAVSITSPAAGATVSGTVAVAATVSDAAGIASVTFLADGVVIATDTTSPFSANWNASAVANGSHTLRAEARDVAGNVGTSAPVAVTVGAPSDTTGPSVSITSPAAGATVTGTVAVAATASDAAGVASVTFKVDGTVIGTDTSAPFSVNWDTSAVAAGAHTLRAEAKDAANNVGTSAPVSVTTAPPPDTTAPTVSIKTPTGGATVTGTVDIEALASDAVGVASVVFKVDGTVIGTELLAPYIVSWDTSASASGSHTLRAEARDAAGNVGVSAAVTVTVAAANKPPVVTMTATGSSYVAPAALTLAATASDPDGTVSRVDFYEGATKVGSDSASPFSMPWTAGTARTYVFSAIAVDNTGATATSASVSVAVTSAPAPRPSTAIFQPSADHSIVTNYVFDVFNNGSNPATSTPIATRNLGKPPVVSGEISADIAATTAALAPGTYIATIAAVTSTQSVRSTPSAPFVIASGTTSITASIDVAEQDTSASAGLSAGDAHDLVWVANSSTGLVAAFDATTGDVLATIPVGLTPTGLAVANEAGKVYVADQGSDTVSVISKATMTLSGTIALPAPSGRKPDHVSTSPDGRFIYVAESGANVVDVIDTATDRISARFSTGWPGSRTRAVISDPSGAVLYAMNRGNATLASTLVALDAETGQWQWQMPIAGDAKEFLITPDGRIAIVTRAADSRIQLIDLERRAVIQDLDLGPNNYPGAVQLTPDGRFLLATVGMTPERVAVVDLTTRTAQAPVSLRLRATGLAQPAAQLFYLAVPGSSEYPAAVIAIDPASGSVVRQFRFPGGGSPQTAVFDPN
jgi:YVTN family beta-propeller protein